MKRTDIIGKLRNMFAGQEANANTSAMGKGATTGIIGGTGISWPRNSEVSLVDKKYILDRDENVALACTSIAEAVIGDGHTILVQGKDLSEQQIEKIKQPLVQFAQDNDIDGQMFDSERLSVAVGVSFTEKILLGNELVKISPLPIDYDWRVKLPDTTGGPEFEFAQQFQGGYKFTPDTLIMWPYNRNSSSEWCGRGICDYLAVSKTYSLIIDGESKDLEVPPLYVIWWAMQDGLRLAASQLAPTTYLMAKNADDDWVKNNSKTINNAQPGEKKLTNQELDSLTVGLDSRTRIDALNEAYDQMIMRACQVPSPALYSREGYKMAAADPTMQQFKRKITMRRRIRARKLEREIYSVIAKQNGIDLKNVQIRVAWLTDDRPIMQLQDYVNLASMVDPVTNEPYLTRDEFRSILKDVFKVPLSDNAPKTRLNGQAPNVKGGNDDEPTNENN